MTKEEKELIFNRLFELEEQHPAFAENVRDDAYCEAITDVKRIIDGIKEHSLPSNLDEAAEEYGRKEYSHAIHFWDEGLSKNKPEVMKEDFVDSFKAGAGWMAGQFQKIEGELVDWYSTSGGENYCCGIKTIDAFEVPEGFYIRKKQ